MENASTALGTERVGKLMLRYAMPSIISFVVNALYNMVDQIFIGRSVGYIGNAATSIILPIATLMMALCFMLGDGCAAYLSLSLGRRRADLGAKAVGNAMVLSVLSGIVMCALFEIFMQPACRFFGCNDEVMPYALEYGRIIVAGFPLSAIAISFGSPIRADGRPKESMLGLLVGCAANFILDPLFIFVFNWGMAGAALATIIGQSLNAVLYIIGSFRFKSVAVTPACFRLSPAICGGVCKLGMSSFITQIATVCVITATNNVIVTYGALSKYGADIPLAAFGITVKVNMLLVSVILGLALGAQPILGYNYGAQQFDRVKHTYKLAVALGTVISILGFLVFELVPDAIISIFGNESELYNEFARKSFRIFLLATPLLGVSTITPIFFQSIGKPVHATFLSLSRQILFLIPLLYIFAYIFGLDGFLAAGPVSDTICFILSVLLVALRWKKVFAADVKS
ncbi:MAG: MATE family efflux transporter [Oscillospiraceae bacterium]|nr:MATE family efflux transporter [Oscillospiraceae bacterium]